MAISFTTLIFYVYYDNVEHFFYQNFSEYSSNRTLLFALAFSITVVVLFSMLQRLMSQLFVKGQEAREKELKQFSHQVSKTLDIDEIVEIYKRFIKSNLPAEQAYIFLWNEQKQK